MLLVIPRINKVYSLLKK